MSKYTIRYNGVQRAYGRAESIGAALNALREEFGAIHHERRELGELQDGSTPATIEVFQIDGPCGPGSEYVAEIVE